MKTALIWQLSHSSSAEIVGTEWIKATVPGCVQLDMAAAHNIPLYYKGDYEDQYTWMEDEYWRYRAETYIENNDFQPFLVLKSVEYKYDVFVNSEKVSAHEGMFSEMRLDMSSYKGQNVTVDVLIYPAPKVCESIGRGFGNEASASCKPAFSYGWDWCPRFVTLGIVDDAYIEYLPYVHPENFKVSYRMGKDLKSAKVILECKTSADEVKYSLFDTNGNEVLSGGFHPKQNTYTFDVNNPDLWWPHNHGKQPVYTLNVSFLKNGKIADTIVKKIGFRRVKLVVNEGVWDKDWVAAVRPADAPMTLEINNKRIFVKGSNWVPPEMCRAQLKRETVKELLTMLREANMNALRMWGGGYIHPDFFYDMCDELGVLVWQEFPLACACYSDEDDYLNILRQESTSIIESLRTHPCIMLWCGGNELFNDWSKMTIQSKALRLLETQTYLLDEDVPFLYTSPQYGVVHGPYDMVDIHGVEGLTTVINNQGTAFTEFACGGPSEWKYLESFMTDDALSQSFRHEMWQKRHAMMNGLPKNRWLDVETIKKVSGCSDDPKEIVACGNDIQSVMYKGMFEAVRRKWPNTSMCMNWCYNEPWPTAAGNGLINYPNVKRPCYYAVQRALKSTKLSIEFSRVSWHSGEEMNCTSWLLNDSESIIEKGKAVISLIVDGKETMLTEWYFPETFAYSNSKGLQFKLKVPDTKCGRFSLVIRSEMANELNDSYEFFINN